MMTPVSHIKPHSGLGGGSGGSGSTTPIISSTGNNSWKGLFASTPFTNNPFSNTPFAGTPGYTGSTNSNSNGNPVSITPTPVSSGIGSFSTYQNAKKNLLATGLPSSVVNGMVTF